MGTGIGPGGSLKRLPRSFEIVTAIVAAMKRAKRVFSRRRRSIVVVVECVLCFEGNGNGRSGCWVFIERF